MNLEVIMNNRCIAQPVKRADTFWLRLKGLLGKKALKPGEGLLLIPCSQIHTWFMAFPIDVLYLDQDGWILKLESELKPGKVGPMVKTCRQVLELSAGAIAAHGLAEGQQLLFKEVQ